MLQKSNSQENTLTRTTLLDSWHTFPQKPISSHVFFALNLLNFKFIISTIMQFQLLWVTDNSIAPSVPFRILKAIEF